MTKQQAQIDDVAGFGHGHGHGQGQGNGEGHAYGRFPSLGDGSLRLLPIRTGTGNNLVQDGTSNTIQFSELRRRF